MRARVRAYVKGMRVCICLDAHVSVHTYICLCVHVCLRVLVYVCMHPCIYLCGHFSAYAYASAGECACLRLSLQMRVYVQCTLCILHTCIMHVFACMRI